MWEITKFFAWAFFIFSGLLLLFYAMLATLWHYRMKRRDREMEDGFQEAVNRQFQKKTPY